MRVELYQAMRASTDLAEHVQDRIIQASAIGTEKWEGTPKRPFITYRMHTDFPVKGVGRREYCQIWVNDDPGSYERIDECLRLIRRAVEAMPPSGNFLEARWVETGVDLEDKAMGTINRYIRFQLTGTLRERTEA